MSTRRINAAWDDRGVVVYQAFEPRTAEAAARDGRFGVGFGMDRYSWIKPSFGWMLYRSGYATKHRQESVLRITITHEGLLSALRGAVLTHWEPSVHESEGDWQLALKHSRVRVQWDPDRDLCIRPLDRRAIQIGLGPAALDDYVNRWVVSIEDVTSLAHAVRDAVLEKAPMPAVPEERDYPLPDDVARGLGVTE